MWELGNKVACRYSWAMAYFSMEQIFSHEVFPYMLGVGIAEFVGLLIFCKISLD